MTYLGKTQRIVFLLTIFVVLLTSCKGKVETSENSEELFSSVFESMAENGESEDNSQNSTDESLEDNGVIDVSFVSSGGGYVSGSVKQSLLEGEVTKSVTAHPALCYKFKEWSDGVTEQTRSKESFAEDTVLTAVFEYMGLPELYIEYKGGISKYGPRKATYTMKNASGLYEFDSLSGVIQGRGNSSWNHAKKPYKIKFDEAVNMLGIGQKAKRDWVILGNHGDQSLLRNYYAFNLAYKAGIGYKSTLIEVYLNGKYNGVYLLTGKVEESRLNVDEKKRWFSHRA
ncbi:MAG: CotH kinase family protein [Clostridia bacterium]|nr:CotH kinase family protein [Clostridia bacterium]